MPGSPKPRSGDERMERRVELVAEMLTRAAEEIRAALAALADLPLPVEDMRKEPKTP